MLWAALIFALGLAGGPLVLSQTANLGLEFGLKVGAGFALVGLLANAAVALFSRWSVPGQLVAMACVCVLVTGAFLFGATAYLLGRQQAIEEAKPEPQPPPPNPGSPNPTPTPTPSDPPPNPTPRGAPSHVDRARTKGVSALDDGPADVTALTIAPDGTTLGVGHADGTTRLCRLDQPTFDSILPGPKADGPVTRVRFDSTSRFVFAITPTSAIATTRNGPFVTLAKIPGAPVAIAPALASDRVHFAAVRGNALQHRSLSTAFILRPPVKEKDMGIAYALPGKGDEMVPPGASARTRRDPAVRPVRRFSPGPSAENCSPVNRTAPSRSGRTRCAPKLPNHDHKAAVKAWADCPKTGDFATGDDQGHVVWWPNKGEKPTVFSILAPPITALSFAPSGARLAVADTTGWLVIWDVAAGKALHRIKRPTPVKVMAFGPNDDVVILAAGKTVEVWSVPELAK